MTVKDNKTVNFIYQDTQIHFLINPTDENVMVNATEMAKLFDKRTGNFLANKETKDTILALERTPISVRSEGQNNSEQTGMSVHSDLKIVEDRGHMGIYFHRLLAIDFASWLDKDFKVWVLTTIDKIIFGNLKEYRDAMKQEVAAQKLRKPLTYNLKNNPCKETVEAYFKNEELLNDAKKRKRKATENQKSLFEQDFIGADVSI